MSEAAAGQQDGHVLDAVFAGVAQVAARFLYGSLSLLPFCYCSLQVFLDPELHNFADQRMRNG